MDYETTRVGRLDGTKNELIDQNLSKSFIIVCYSGQCVKDCNQYFRHYLPGIILIQCNSIGLIIYHQNQSTQQCTV